MLSDTLQRIANERLGPDGVRQAFYLLQLGLGLVCVGLAWALRRKPPESGFAVREADLRAKRPRSPGSSAAADLAQARYPGRATLALPGIRLDAPAHEILGVSEAAGAGEIQRAYRERMKQYHPDKVAPPGTPQWQEAQKIAEAINRARNELLKRGAPRR